MKVDEILVMWQGDGEVDEHHFDSESMKTAKLHAKYLRLLVEAKLKKAKLESDYNALRQAKFRYYRGEMSQSELDSYQWEQWQYNKPLKAEMDEFLKGDQDLIKHQSKLEYIDTVVYALESIMAQIKQRDWQIKNAITWKQFLAGN